MQKKETKEVKRVENAEEAQEVEKELTIKNSFSELGKIQKAFTKEQMDFIVKTIAPGLNQRETWLFLLKANVLKLNPLLGEIFAYVYVDKQTGNRRLVVIEGRNGKRNLAARTGRIESIRTEPIYIKEVKNRDGQTMKIKVEPWDGVLWGARCSIRIKGKKEVITETVKLSEYNTHKSIWISKPETMIKKVAESQALSAALPELMLDLVGEAENFVQPKHSLPPIAGGSKPASEAMLKTLQAMKADMNRTWTVQEANEEIVRRSKIKKVEKAKKIEKIKK